MTVRVGIAGLGIHGSRYAQHLLAGDVPGAKLAAVSRRDETSGRAFAARHGLTFTPDPRELATLSGIDVVVVVLPPDLHPPLAEACLDAGRPVLVEKPLACDAESARRLARRASDGGPPLMVAQTLRFDAVVQALRRESRELGALRMLSIHQRFEPFHRGWIDDPVRGGMLLNTAVHGFDLMRYLTGAEPVSIYAELDRVLTRNTEDQFAATVRLEPGGILATLDNTRTTDSRSGRVELVGERGQLAGDHVHRTLTRVEGRTETDLGPIPDQPTVPETLRAFVHSITKGEPPPITAEDGLAAVELVDAARRSATESQRIALPRAGSAP